MLSIIFIITIAIVAFTLLPLHYPISRQVFADVGMMQLSKEGRKIKSSSSSSSSTLSLLRRPPPFCNPLAVDFVSYKKKLTKLCDRITNRIIAISKKALKEVAAANPELDEELESRILPSTSKESTKAHLVDLLVKFRLDDFMAAEVTPLENEFMRAEKYRRRSEEIRQMSSAANKSTSEVGAVKNDDVKKKNKKKTPKKTIYLSEDDAKKDADYAFLLGDEDAAALTSPTDEASSAPPPNSSASAGVIGALKGQRRRPKSAELSSRGVTFKDPPVETASIQHPEGVDASLSTLPRPSSSSNPRRQGASSSFGAAPSSVRVSTGVTRRAFGVTGVNDVQVDDLTRPKLGPHSLKGMCLIVRFWHLLFIVSHSSFAS